MKSILLTTTAIVAFAGAAAAGGHTSIGFTGDAGLGYNDDYEEGFYWDLNLDLAATAALDNGITATVSGEMNLSSDNAVTGSVETSFDELKIVVASEMATLSFGDLEPVAEDNYGGVDGDSTGGFFDDDAHFDTVGFDAILAAEVNVAGITAMASFGVLDETDGANITEVSNADAMQLYATGAFGAVSVEGAYQAAFGEDGTGAAITNKTVLGLSASTTVAGFELTGAYLARSEVNDVAGTDESSIGFGASYPVGPVTLAGYYSVNDVAEDGYGVSADYADGPFAVNAYYEFDGNTDATDEATEMGVEGSYDTGLGLTVLAGYISTEVGAADALAQTYVAGVYDLGGGASILMSYADDEANDGVDPADMNDEIGDPEYLQGTTVKVSFKF